MRGFAELILAAGVSALAGLLLFVCGFAAWVQGGPEGLGGFWYVAAAGLGLAFLGQAINRRGLEARLVLAPDEGALALTLLEISAAAAGWAWLAASIRLG